MQDTSARPFFQRHARLLGLLAFLLVLAVLAQVTGLRSQLTVQVLQDRLHANPWTGLALFVLAFCVGNILQVPGWIFLAAAVFAFGRVQGGLVTYVAACLSCLFTFAAIRLVGGNVAATLKSPIAQRLLAQLHAHPLRNVLILRTLFQTLPALNYALALSGLRLRHYVLGTLLGLPLPIAVYCVFFDVLIAAAHKL
jgi:uncharacterized membrane protein YdjX (TVP38/TMEM64 family)